ncbi:MAG: precorrin-2 C(20)-methyltransferase [Thermoguttaceae bacterium]|jgi:precorrin-2/cobalt-factor-2 C20-methyltransferase
MAVSLGILYGIGVGPGDPEWITVQAVRILAGCRHVCAPRSQAAGQSVALEIARSHLHPEAVVHEIGFPMSPDKAVLARSWRQAAGEVHAILARGDDCCFLTLGDPLLYSTYVYLLEHLRALDPGIRMVTVPGITAMSAAAALASFALGRGKEPVTIVPAADDLAPLAAALDRGGTVVLMKIGGRLSAVLDLLAERGLLGRGVLVSHAGMAHQRVETDLARLRAQPQESGYLATLIVHAGQNDG